MGEEKRVASAASEMLHRQSITPRKVALEISFPAETSASVHPRKKNVIAMQCSSWRWQMRWLCCDAG